MTNDWIIDVIADLRIYASHHGLSALAQQLDEATAVAAVELASKDNGLVNAGKCTNEEPRRVSGTGTSREVA